MSEEKKNDEFEIEELQAGELEQASGGSCDTCSTCAGCMNAGCMGCGQVNTPP